MKQIMLLLVFCLSCFVAVGAELTEEQLEKLEKSVKITSVNDETIKGDDGVKIEVLKFGTYHNEDDAYSFRMRIILELEDRQKNTYFAQMERAPNAVGGDDYTGEDNWKFQVSHGDLERPKISAYAIQYGIFLDGKFIVLAEEFDDVDTVEELTERTTTRLEQKPVILHQYSYRESGDDDGEIVQSQWK